MPSSIILPCNGLDVDKTTTFFFPFDFVLLRCLANVFLLLFKMTNCNKILSFLGVKKFLARIFVADLHYPQVLRIAVFHLSTCHLGWNQFLPLHRTVHQDFHLFHRFHLFPLPAIFYIIQSIIK